jgi:hypothetical protein
VLAPVEAEQEASTQQDWDGEWNNSDDSDVEMPSDLRPELNRHNDGRSYQPLLAKDREREHGYDDPFRPTISRRSTFHERDPEGEAAHATKKRYTYAAFFLVLSLVSFAVQTETAVYIQSQLRWKKAYCMLCVAHPLAHYQRPSTVLGKHG